MRIQLTEDNFVYQSNQDHSEQTLQKNFQREYMNFPQSFTHRDHINPREAIEYQSCHQYENDY